MFVGVLRGLIHYLIRAAQQHDVLGTFSNVMLFVAPLAGITRVVSVLRWQG